MGTGEEHISSVQPRALPLTHSPLFHSRSGQQVVEEDHSKWENWRGQPGAENQRDGYLVPMRKSETVTKEEIEEKAEVEETAEVTEEKTEKEPTSTDTTHIV